MRRFFEPFRSNGPNEKLINAAKEGKVDMVNNLLDDKKRIVNGSVLNSVSNPFPRLNAISAYL